MLIYVLLILAVFVGVAVLSFLAREAAKRRNAGRWPTSDEIAATLAAETERRRNQPR